MSVVYDYSCRMFRVKRFSLDVSLVIEKSIESDDAHALQPVYEDITEHV